MLNARVGRRVRAPGRLLGVVGAVEAAMLHNQGWRAVPGMVPDWFAAVGAFATVRGTRLVVQSLCDFRLVGRGPL
jgi:hypothetical protein